MTSRRSHHRRPSSRWAMLVIALLLQGLVAACSTPQRAAAVPGGLTAQAQTVVPNARFFPNRDDPNFITEGRAAFEREMAWLKATGHTGPLPPGAGLLTGWSESGTRPEFKLVTGVSTGALIAPFAFLGPKYDNVLRETYTDV